MGTGSVHGGTSTTVDMHRAPDHVAVHCVGRQPAAGPVDAFQHEDVRAGLLEPEGGGEASDASADDDDPPGGHLVSSAGATLIISQLLLSAGRSEALVEEPRHAVHVLLRVQLVRLRVHAPSSL